MAYKLDLPIGCFIHPVFHITYLKLKLGSNVVPIPTLPHVDDDGLFNLEPIAILQTRSKKLRNRFIIKVLDKWWGKLLEDATWESLFFLQNKFPHLVGRVL